MIFWRGLSPWLGNSETNLTHFKVQPSPTLKSFLKSIHLSISIPSFSILLKQNARVFSSNYLLIFFVRGSNTPFLSALISTVLTNLLYLIFLFNIPHTTSSQAMGAASLQASGRWLIRAKQAFRPGEIFKRQKLKWPDSHSGWARAAPTSDQQALCWTSKLCKAGPKGPEWKHRAPHEHFKTLLRRIQVLCHFKNHTITITQTHPTLTYNQTFSPVHMLTTTQWP